MLNGISCHIKYALLVFLGLVVIVLLSKWTGKRAGPGHIPPPSTAKVKQVVTKAADSNTASHSSHQDVVDSLVDVTSAIVSLKTAVDLAGDKDVKAASGVSTQVLEGEMVAHQRNLMSQLKNMLNAPPPPTPHQTPLQPLPQI
jgi:hypothetical protein